MNGNASVALDPEIKARTADADGGIGGFYVIGFLGAFAGDEPKGAALGIDGKLFSGA